MTSHLTSVSTAHAVMPDRERRLSTRSMAALGCAAIVAGLLHIAPFLHARSAAPPGWAFSGNLTVSPDYMQYRVWARQAATNGPIVDNRFTREPNPPHLIVLLYYVVGKLALLTGLSPEWVYAWLGVPLAAALVVLVFLTVSQFLSVGYQRWWVTAVIVLSGGLGAHLKALESIGFVRDSFLLRKTLIEPLWNQVVFEDYRSNYISIVLFDTHFLAIWVVSLAAVLSLYLTLKRYSHGRLVATAGLFAFATILHVYEGVTLAAILVCVCALCWRRGYARRAALIGAVASLSAIALSTGVQILLFRASGLPLPDWRGPIVLVTTLLMAYPIGWLLLATAGTRFWQQQDFPRTVLIGWLIGCTALTLSAPFYPWPNRGAMTLMVPLYVLAGLAYFARHVRVSVAAACLAFVTIGVTPLWMMQHVWKYSYFSDDAPYRFLSTAHRDTIDALVARASKDDVLVAREADLLWLAPEFPGRHYCGHFFLTVDYERRQAEVARFFAASADAQAAFLGDHRIRFVFAAPQRSPVGSLFEYRQW
jgi:hypothetical protein